MNSLQGSLRYSIAEDMGGVWQCVGRWILCNGKGIGAATNLEDESK